MDKREIVDRLNDEFSLSFDCLIWQQFPVSLLTAIGDTLRHGGHRSSDTFVPTWFSSRSQKHATIFEIASLSGLDIESLKPLEKASLTELYRLATVFHQRNEDSDSEEEEPSRDHTDSIFSEEHDSLLYKVNKCSEGEMKNSVQASVLLSSFFLEDVYLGLFVEQDGLITFRSEFHRPEVWFLEALASTIFSAEHPLLDLYHRGRLDQAILKALSSYSLTDFQQIKSIVLSFLLRTVQCPIGQFWMGNDQEDSQRHLVILTQAFQVSVFPVTNVVRSLLVEDDTATNLLHPVTKVSWFDAIAMCNQLSERLGLDPYYEVSETEVFIHPTNNGFRLLTEAEWEYAAKAETEYSFAGSMDLTEVGWYKGNASEIQRIALKKSNNYGLYDMSGNVFEWVWDAYQAYSGDEDTDPRVDEARGLRVTRGGSVDDVRDFAKVYTRLPTPPTLKSQTISFRIGRNQS